MSRSGRVDVRLESDIEELMTLSHVAPGLRPVGPKVSVEGQTDDVVDLFVSNLPPDTIESDLVSFFHNISLRSIRLTRSRKHHKDSSTPKIAFVAVPAGSAAERAFACDGQFMAGRRIAVRPAEGGRRGFTPEPESPALASRGLEQDGRVRQLHLDGPRASVRIPQHRVAAVIGLQGRNVSKIQDDTGARILIHPDGAADILADSGAAVLKAMLQIDAVVNAPEDQRWGPGTRVQVPRELLPVLRTPRGAQLLNPVAGSMAHIWIKDDGTADIVATSPAAVAKAKERLEEFFAKTLQTLTSFEIPKASVGWVIGKAGRGIERIMEESGAIIGVTSEGVVGIAGDVAAVAKAKACIDEIVADQSKRSEAKSDKVERIAEKRRAVELALADGRFERVETPAGLFDERDAKKMMGNTGAFIRWNPNGALDIVGEPDAVLKAKDAVQKAIRTRLGNLVKVFGKAKQLARKQKNRNFKKIRDENELARPAADSNGYSERIAVPPSALGMIIGKHGNNVKAIMAETRSTVIVNADNNTVDITGNDAAGVILARCCIEVLVMKHFRLIEQKGAGKSADALQGTGPRGAVVENSADEADGTSAT